MAYSKSKLTSNGDKASPCFRIYQYIILKKYFPHCPGLPWGRKSEVLLSVQTCLPSFLTLTIPSQFANSVRLEVFMALKIEVAVFWVETPYSYVCLQLHTVG